MQPCWVAYYRIILFDFCCLQNVRHVNIYSRHMDKFPSSVKLNKGQSGTSALSYLEVVVYVWGNSLTLLQGLTWVWKTLNCSVIRETWVSKQVKVALKLLCRVYFWFCFFVFGLFFLLLLFFNFCFSKWKTHASLVLSLATSNVNTGLFSLACFKLPLWNATYWVL